MTTAAERLVSLVGTTGTAGALMLSIGSGATAGAALVAYSGLSTATAAEHLLYNGSGAVTKPKYNSIQRFGFAGIR